jgi:hypothetical protein
VLGERGSAWTRFRRPGRVLQPRHVRGSRACERYWRRPPKRECGDQGARGAAVELALHIVRTGAIVDALWVVRSVAEVEALRVVVALAVRCAVRQAGVRAVTKPGRRRVHACARGSRRRAARSSTTSVSSELPPTIAIQRTAVSGLLARGSRLLSHVAIRNEAPIGPMMMPARRV